ncbi:MAG: TlpA disulfide reductase family protein [Saprospiraceae bacterium]
MQPFKLIALFILLAFGKEGNTQNSEPIKVYDSFDDFQQSELKLVDRGVKLVNFWATWCKPCVKELPYFQQLHEKYPDLPMLLVSLDKKADASEKIASFLAKRGITISTVLLADTRANDWIDKVSPLWSGSIPATLLVTEAEPVFFETDFESLETLMETTQIISYLKNIK